jgi:hypothetical protein
MSREKRGGMPPCMDHCVKIFLEDFTPSRFCLPTPIIKHHLYHVYRSPNLFHKARVCALKIAQLSLDGGFYKPEEERNLMSTTYKLR